MHVTAMSDSSCRICTIQFEALAGRPGAFREILAAGIRLSALDVDASDAGSPRRRPAIDAIP